MSRISEPLCAFRTHTIGKTTFIVSSHFSESSTLTAEEMLTNLLLSKVTETKRSVIS